MTMTTITRPFAFSSIIAAVMSLLLIAAAPTADAQGAAVPNKWQQGRHYRSVSPQMPTSVAPGKVEVLEIFWYGCGACYMLDPYLESWKKKDKPANVEFVRVPVTWNEGAKLHARLFYTLQALKQDERLHAKVFDTIHRGGNGLLGRNEDGKPYYVVPVISRDRADLLPDDCLAQLSPERRRAAEAANAKIRSSPPAWKVCVFSTNGGGCGSARRVAHDGSAGQQGVSETEPIGEFPTLVPDGVAAIRVSYAGNPPRTFPVRRNFTVYRVRLLDKDGQGIGTPTITWLDKNEQPIRTPAP